MEWYEQEVRQLESTIIQKKTTADPVVFYGSSSVRLWDTLAADLGNPRALNLGFGGSTLEACAYFFDRLIVPLNPASLVIYAGDNDLGDGRQPQEVYGFFKALVKNMDARLPGLPFTFLAIKPSPSRAHLLDRIRETNSLIRDAIEARSCGSLFLNIFDAMLDNRCQPRPELFTEDGLHMSRDGYRLWTELLTPYRHRIFIKSSSSL